MMERAARQRALMDIKSDQEKRKHKGGPSSATLTVNNALTERERMQLAFKKEKRLDQEQRQRVLENIRNDQKDKKSKLFKTSSSAIVTTPTQPMIVNSEAFIQVYTNKREVICN